MSIFGHVNIIIFKIKFIPELNTLISIDFQNKTVNMIILFRGSLILTLTWSKCLVIAFCSDPGDQKKKICHCFHFFLFYLDEMMGLDSMI